MVKSDTTKFDAVTARKLQQAEEEKRRRAQHQEQIRRSKAAEDEVRSIPETFKWKWKAKIEEAIKIGHASVTIQVYSHAAGDAAVEFLISKGFKARFVGTVRVKWSDDHTGSDELHVEITW